MCKSGGEKPGEPNAGPYPSEPSSCVNLQAFGRNLHFVPAGRWIYKLGGNFTPH
jgi:hypothetical protein